MSEIASMRLKGDFRGIDRTTLKLVAIITMLIDHIGYVFLPQIKFLRWIGRIAFPIFVYQLVEGYQKTSNLKKYFKRLILFAFISEIPFDLALFGVPFRWEHQNVYLELTLCLLTLVLVDKTKTSSEIMKIVGVFVICLVALLIRADYDIFGILLAVLFYFFRNNFLICAIGIAILSYLFCGTIQLFCLFSLLFIMMYNSKLTTLKFTKPKQFMFYAFYPMHLLLLYVVKLIIV